MNSLTRRNLQEFCRTCLTSLVERCSSNTYGDSKYDLNLLPQLRRLLLIFSSLDALSSDDEYPQKLCQLCYDKLQDFQEFRSMVLESSQKINYILAAPEPSGKHINTTSRMQKNLEDDDDDDKLLMPELAVEWNPNIVKIEPDEELAEQAPSPIKSNEVEVKNEIDSEYEQEDSNCQFNERNALSSIRNRKKSSEKGENHSFRNELFFSARFQSFEKDEKRKMSPRKRDRNKKSLKCPRCDKQVYKKVYLDAHIRAIHEGHAKPFLCSECKKSFTRYNQLNVHMQTNHTVAIKLVCGIAGCSATFKMNQTLETHRRVVHTEEQTGERLELGQIIAIHQQQLVNEWELEHFCKQCGKKYSSKRALREHLKRHAQIKNHVCKVCGVAKVTRTELLTHMRTHESNLEKFKCTLCPQEFNHKNAISRHIRVVHEGERRFTCSFCPRRFGTRHAQISHERLHTGERPFKCDSCPKGFAQIEGLKSHMKNHDKSLRKHVCKFCSQRFITRKNLVDHEQRHLGNKPHICITCSRGFFNRNDLDSHNKIHEEESNNGEKPDQANDPLDENFNEMSTEGESVLGIEEDAIKIREGVRTNDVQMTEENVDETDSDNTTL